MFIRQVWTSDKHLCCTTKIAGAFYHLPGPVQIKTMSSDLKVTTHYIIWTILATVSGKEYFIQIQNLFDISDSSTSPIWFLTDAVSDSQRDRRMINLLIELSSDQRGFLKRGAFIV